MVSSSRERSLVLALAAVGGLRVLLMSATFPVFNNADEPQHYDMVCKYASGEIPRGIENYGLEASQRIVLFESPEYLRTPGDFPEGQMPPPLWTHPPSLIAPFVERARAVWSSEINHESMQAPLYYALAGAWYRLGGWLGLSEGRLLYWIRYLNAPAFATLVGLSYLVARRIYPERTTVRLGVPLLLAFFPQDSQYSIGNDVLSPLLVGLAIYGLLEFVLNDRPDWSTSVRTGLCLAAALLDKFTNLPLVGLAGLVWLRSALVGGTSRESRNWPRVAASMAAAVGALAPWCARTYRFFGDFTGASAQVKIAGWTVKPLGRILDHPLLTPGGPIRFWHELLANFWRGEFTWHGKVLAQGWADHFYSISSLVLVSAAAVGLLRRKVAGERGERLGEIFCLLAWILAVASLVAGSLAYDFGDAWLPTSRHPYMTTGRWISGMLIPFLILYVRGLDRLLSLVRSQRAVLLTVSGIVVLVTVSEISLTWPVFGSAYNWFHLP
jgi:Predicted membrane protein (DUF2142)